MWPPPFLWLTTTESVLAVGFLRSTALRYLGSGGKGMPKIQGKITFSRKLVLSWRRQEGFGFKNKNFGGFPPGQEAPKTNF